MRGGRLRRRNAVCQRSLPVRRCRGVLGLKLYHDPAEVARENLRYTNAANLEIDFFAQAELTQLNGTGSSSVDEKHGTAHDSQALHSTAQD